MFFGLVRFQLICFDSILVCSIWSGSVCVLSMHSTLSLGGGSSAGFR